MSLASHYNTELLAPAGSIESFFAALEAGADAVYCGLHEFSARAKAKNFSMAEMENLSAYAHKEGCKIYIPLNTLIKEHELAKLSHILEGIAGCQVDGLIIQDLGVYHLIRKFFPEIPLHASTQMAVHNSAGVQVLEQLGFERAVLARELTLAEISAIRQETSIELEHFIHGALCYSISGHCLFSSFQTGKSGNRGGCAQPCRRQYDQNNSSQFTFSTSDFSALPLLDKLAQSGVMSFKIEGRMKNAEYVWSVVRAYREVLDCHEADQTLAIRRAETILAESHGRQTSSGFLSGKRNSILLPKQKGGIGTPTGTVEQVSGKTIAFTAKTNLHIGDKIRVQPATDQPGTGFTILDIRVGKKNRQQAKAGQWLTTQTPFFDRFKIGDQIFKISSGRGFTLSEAACRRRLSTAPCTKINIDLHLACTTTTLTITSTAPISWQQTYEVETFPALNSPLNVATLHNIFKKTVHPHLKLARMAAEDLPPVVIKPSILKGIRRNFYDQFSAKLHSTQQDLIQNRQRIIHHELAQQKQPTQPSTPQLFIHCDQPHEDLLKDQNLQLIVPLELDSEKQTRQDNYIWNIPTIIYPENWQKIQEMVINKHNIGQKRFRLNNISHLQLFTDLKGIALQAGPRLYTLNHQALQAMQALGISRFTTSIEDDRTNINALSRYSHNLIIPIYADVSLMTSRIPLSTDAVISSKTEELHPSVANGLTHIQTSTPFSLSGHLDELQELNPLGYLVDLRGHNQNERYRVMQAIKANHPIEPSTLFNYQRGLV